MHHKTHQLQERLSRAKAAYTTRRIDLTAATTLLRSKVIGQVSQVSNDLIPQAGDIVLARVNKIGQHQRLELANGRRASLFVGDEVLVSYGNRYAPDQFEALAPNSLTVCDLVAASGIAASTVARHDKTRVPTRLAPIGILGNSDGQRLNLADAALPQAHTSRPRPLTLAVVGTSMNAGKTTTAAHLIKGLVASGLKVGAAKITGTGAGLMCG
jgi:hypothetical protein